MTTGKKTSGSRKASSKSRAGGKTSSVGSAAKGSGSRSGGSSKGKSGGGSTATEPRITPLQRVERGERIIAARHPARGRAKAWEKIAKDEELSERQCRRIYQAAMRWGTLRRSPTAIVEHTLDMIEASLMELDEIVADAAAEKNLNARIGAIRLIFEALAGRWEIMRASGLMPRDMGRWQDAADTRVLFERFVDALLRHGVSGPALDDVQALMTEFFEKDGSPVGDAPALPDIDGAVVR
jgi:hypothetical protein